MDPARRRPPRRRPAAARFLATAAGAALLLAACGRGGPADDVAAEPPPGTPAPALDVVGTTEAPPPDTVPDTAPPETEAPTTTAATSTTSAPETTTSSTTTTVAGDPQPRNLYAATTAFMSPTVAGHRPLVYVPHELSGDTWVIDPATRKVVGTFPTGAESQHVVPAWDLTTLYTVSSAGNLVTPIDPGTGQPGRSIPVDDPYNLYFLPDGSEAIVVAEGRQRLDFTDPRTFARHSSLQTACAGINHMDFSADGSFAVATCEFEGAMIKIDLRQRQVVDKISFGRGAMPQDVRIAPDGSFFYVADLTADGVHIIDAAAFRKTGFVPTGVGAHSLYPSRDATKLYVINRGTHNITGRARAGEARGSVTVLDFSTTAKLETWGMPNGGSPDMGNLSTDGTELWLGGRYDGEIYVFDTVKGGLTDVIKVGTNPHGLTYWPQPGRSSLGHTGNMR